MLYLHKFVVIENLLLFSLVEIDKNMQKKVLDLLHNVTSVIVSSLYFKVLIVLLQRFL